MIIGAGQQFPRNNSHCVFQLQNGSGGTFSDTANGKSANRDATKYGSIADWQTHTPTVSEPFSSNILFDGTDDCLTFEASADFNPYNANCTWEFFWKPESLQRQMFFEYYYLDSTKYFITLFFRNTNYGIVMEHRYNGTKYVYAKENWNGTGVTGYNVEQCYHIAMVKNGLNWKVYRDGKQIISNNATEEKDHSGNGILYIGGYFHYLHGALANVRFHKGIALWTRNFTPPNRAS